MRKSPIIKKTILFIISLASFTSLSAQQVQVREIAHIDFPERTLKLSKEQFTAIMQHGDSLLSSPFWNNYDEFYIVDSFLLTLHAERLTLPKDYLETRKKDFNTPSEWNQYANDSSSKIKTVNNYRVLISGMDTRYSYHYFLFCVNRNNSAIITGELIQFKSKDYNKAKALNTIDELLENFAFKL